MYEVEVKKVDGPGNLVGFGEVTVNEEIVISNFKVFRQSDTEELYIVFPQFVDAYGNRIKTVKYDEKNATEEDKREFEEALKEAYHSGESVIVGNGGNEDKDKPAYAYLPKIEEKNKNSYPVIIFVGRLFILSHVVFYIKKEETPHKYGLIYPKKDYRPDHISEYSVFFPRNKECRERLAQQAYNTFEKIPDSKEVEKKVEWAQKRKDNRLRRRRELLESNLSLEEMAEREEIKVNSLLTYFDEKQDVLNVDYRRFIAPDKLAIIEAAVREKPSDWVWSYEELREELSDRNIASIDLRIARQILGY